MVSKSNKPNMVSTSKKCGKMPSLILSLCLFLFLANHRMLSKLLFSGVPSNFDDTQPMLESGEISNTVLKSGKMIIAGFSDHTFFPLTKIWYNQMTKLGYTEHIVVATDNKTAEKCEREQMRYELAPVDETATHRRALWYQRIFFCKKKVEAGVSVLLTDVDNDFHRYVPLETFRDSGYDVIHAYEGRFPVWIFKQQGFVVCAGMVWFTATPEALNLLNLWEASCSQGAKSCNDQVELNLIYLKVLDMDWNRTPEETTVRVKSNDGNNGLLEIGMVGKSPVTNHTVKIWDRDFAWRGPFVTEKCPSLENNWMTMQTELSYQYLVEKNDKVKNKMQQTEMWQDYCGPNGTNREKGHENALEAAYKRYLERKKINA